MMTTTVTVYATEVEEISTATETSSSENNTVLNSSYSTSGTITLNSTTDLHLAYNNVDYSVIGVKSSGTWTLFITFTDFYDFDTQAWKNEMTDSTVVTILNNYAAYAQSLGAIQNYYVYVTVQVTF